MTLLGLVRGREKDEALASADCLVLPSYAEGLPMAILEGMSYGIPVIATRIGAIPEVVTDGQEGFLIEPGDVPSLADRMLRISSDPEMRERIGQAARRRIEVHYSLDVMVDRIMNVYADVLEESGGTHETVESAKTRKDNFCSARSTSSRARGRYAGRTVGGTQSWTRRSARVLSVSHRTRSAGILRHSTGAWLLESPPTSPGFADEVAALARELDVGSVMTIAEAYHVALIRSRDRFEPDIHVFSPPAEGFAKATDKHFMHGSRAQLGVPVARGTTLDKLMAEQAAGQLRFPLVLRTRGQNAADEAAPWKAAYAEIEPNLNSSMDRSSTSPTTCSCRSTTPAWRTTCRSSCTGARRSWSASTSANITCRWPAE